MGLFSRKASKEEPEANGGASFIGRKFRSDLSLEECLKNFADVKERCYDTKGPLIELSWQVPTVDEGFASTQGQVPSRPPARVVGSDLTDGGRIYLAFWDGVASYGNGEPGPPTEMWFVPPGFDTSPIPIAGNWKGIDASLSSIGYVEAALWGLQP